MNIIAVRKPFSMDSSKSTAGHNLPSPTLEYVHPRVAGGVNIVRVLGLFRCVHMRACVDPIREIACTTDCAYSQVRNWILAQGPYHVRGLAQARKSASRRAFQTLCQLPQHCRAARCAIALCARAWIVLTIQTSRVCRVAKKKKARTVVRKTDIILPTRPE